MASIGAGRWMLGLVLALTTGCAALTQTPKGFVRLDDATWDYRATSADGVVITIRHLAHDPEGEVDFWASSVEGELRARGGYTLRDRKDVTTASGRKGTLLRFRHLAAEQEYAYYVALFLDEDLIGPDDLFVVEAGGRADAVASAEAEILSAIEQLRVD